MPEYDINAVIETGDYDLTIQERLPFRKGEEMAYEVLEGGIVQEDGSIPCTVKLKLPPRLRGRVVKARLVPHNRTVPLLMGMGVTGLA